ncbi:methyltransferase, type 11 [Desulfosarcina variabilis str. Montpellier]
MRNFKFLKVNLFFKSKVYIGMNRQAIGANPVGVIGKLAGRVMNLIHKKQYERIVQKIYKSEKEKSINIVDIGCGGGIAVKHLSKVFDKAQVFGIDISSDMVNLSKKMNRRAISEGRVKILNNDVENMYISDGSIKIITVFDNINFWTNHSKAFSEIKRVLCKNGRIFIVNGYPEVGTRWYDFVKFKNIDDYRNLFDDNGFSLRNHELSGRTIILEGAFSYRE